MTTPGFTQVALALVLVAIAVAVGRWRGLSVSRDMTFGSIRAVIQLVAVGYALQFIFDLESTWLIGLAMLIMLTVGAHAASGRVKSLKGSFAIALVAIFVGSSVTMGTMLILDIITFEARYVIPLSGMIIGNAMNASALAVERLASDIRSNRLRLETSLALGKSWRSASRDYQRAAARTGMISILNFLKTVGIVALPGAMTGMILAGADPLEAVLLQIIVAYMLLAAVTVTSVAAVEMTVRKFFTGDHQLKHGI